MDLTAADLRSGGDVGTSGRAQAAEGPRRPAASLRKCASTPALRLLGAPAGAEAEEGAGLEVFVVLRNFQETLGGVLHRLPPRVRDCVRDAGVCHYMIAVRKPDGSIVQFDFGPKAGGDIHVGAGPLAAVLSKAPRARGRASRRVDGTVRECQLSSLPEAHMYVGRTPLTLADIRAWNSVHEAAEYELHRSDCRHYVNAVVRYATGLERATASALRHQCDKGAGRGGLARRVVRLAHYVTDVANWDRVRGAGQAAAAAVMTLAGQRALGPLLQSVQRRLVPVARTGLVPVSRALARRPVYAVGTAAVATLAASGGQAPGAVRDAVTVGARVAGGVQMAVRAAARLAQHAGRSASAATQQTTSQAAALAAGIAGVATRGAASMMAARPRGVAAAREPARVAQPAAGGSPLRATLPSFSGARARQLALVASRR